MRGKRVKDDSISIEKIIIFIIIIIVIIMGIFVFKPQKENSTNNKINNQNQASVSDYHDSTQDVNNETDKENIQILTIDDKNIWEGKRYNVGATLKLKDSNNVDIFSRAILIECDENYDIIEAKTPIDITTSLKDKGYTFNETGIYLIQLFDKNNSQLTVQSSIVQ